MNKTYEYIQFKHGHSLETRYPLETWYPLSYAQDCVEKVYKIKQIMDEYKHNQIDADGVICEILKYIK